MESTVHSIIRCDVAKRVWDCWDFQFGEIGQELFDVSEAALQIWDKRSVRDLEFFFVVAWSIWHNRNSVVFESVCSLPNHIWGFASRYLHEYRMERVAVNKKQAAGTERWTPPPPGVFKVNVDGATSEDGRNSSVGAIIRDSYGAVIAACCKYFQGHYSVAEVEALAVEAGILLAHNMKISQVIIESDAVSTVSDFSAKLVDGSLGHLYQGILAMLNSFSSWKIKHLKREYNKVAHELAHIARVNEVSQVWVGDYPSVLLELVQADCIGKFICLLPLSPLLYSNFCCLLSSSLCFVSKKIRQDPYALQA